MVSRRFVRRSDLDQLGLIARGATTLPDLKPTTQRKALTDLAVIGILNASKPNVYTLYVNPFDAKYQLKPSVLLAILEKLTGPKEAVRLLRRKPTAPSRERRSRGR